MKIFGGQIPALTKTLCVRSQNAMPTQKNPGLAAILHHVYSGSETGILDGRLQYVHRVVLKVIIHDNGPHALIFQVGLLDCLLEVAPEAQNVAIVGPPCRLLLGQWFRLVEIISGGRLGNGGTITPCLPRLGHLGHSRFVVGQTIRHFDPLSIDKAPLLLPMVSLLVHLRVVPRKVGNIADIQDLEWLSRTVVLVLLQLSGQSLEHDPVIRGKRRVRAIHCTPTEKHSTKS
mmetsp:Transcript_1870/g.4202  ORF Transcript_1870/g.4202 Transcript_1870/m.4202 type:complete len:231 (-) Transcript_1870:7-699(-)